MFDIYCPHCGEPHDQDMLHEAAEYGAPEGLSYMQAARLFKTHGCGLVILQLVGTQKAWAAEKDVWWVQDAEDIDAARLEFMATLYEYSQEEVVSAAFDEQAWPFDWGYVTEAEEQDNG
jgi:phage terminase large subunit GpA-like protein